MAEYTPTTEQMLDMYAGHVCSDGKRRIVATRRKEFYGWLAQHVKQDERIQAWEAIAAHAAFADCYQEERPLLESVIDRIDALVSTEEAVVELAPSSLQAEIERLNATIQRVRDIVNDKYLDAGQMDVMLHRALEAAQVETRVTPSWEQLTTAIALEFEGCGEAWIDDSSGDRLASVAADAVLALFNGKTEQEES